MSRDRTGFGYRQRVGRSVTWVWVASASLVAAAGGAAMWWLAIPRGTGVCFAILPAPPGCASDARIPVAILWSMIITVGYGVHLAVSLSTLRRHTWLVVVTLLILLVAAGWGYRAVLYA